MSHSERIEWIDRWRGLLIAQIVLFHVLGVFGNNAVGFNQDLIAGAAGFIEHYHISAFVILSAICWRARGGIIGFSLNRFIRLMVPYFVFGIIWAVLFIVGGERFIGSHQEYASLSPSQSFAWYSYLGVIIGHSALPMDIKMKIINVLWFLPTFYIASLIYFGVDRFFSGTKKHIFFMLVMFAVWLKVRWMQLPCGLSDVPKFVILFIVGRIFVADVLVRISTWGFSSKALVMVALFAVLAIPNGILNACYGLGCEKWNIYVYAVFGSVATACLAQLVNFRWLSVVGCASLGILVVHKFIIIALQIVPGLITAVAKKNCVLALLGAVAVTGIVTAISVAIVIFLRRFCPVLIGEIHRKQ